MSRPQAAPATIADRILAALKAAGRPMSPKAIHAATGGKYQSVRSTLLAMKDRGDVVSLTRGSYELPARDSSQEYVGEKDGHGGDVCLMRVTGPDGRAVFSLYLRGRLVQEGPPVELQAAPVADVVS